MGCVHCPAGMVDCRDFEEGLLALCCESEIGVYSWNLERAAFGLKVENCPDIFYCYSRVDNIFLRCVREVCNSDISCCCLPAGG